MPRLDQALVERGLAPTRARARDAILRGHVLVDGALATRPAQPVGPDNELAVTDPAAGYVSRGALKILHALDHFGYDPAGLPALDLGASTGGFTQVLLERGASHVTAVDVGHGQMAAALAVSPKVRLLEGVNARDLGAAHLSGPVGAIVSDVSFISQRLVLPPALGHAAPGAFAVVLVKPQFELGRDHLDKRGVVKRAADALKAAETLAQWLGSRPGWRVDGLVPSPILGGDGNQEFLLGARKSSDADDGSG